MKKFFLLAFFVCINATVFAQASKTDTIYLAIYNTGNTFVLKRAPYGEQLPKTDSVKEMVVAQDSFVTKLNKIPANFVPKTFAEIEKLLPKGNAKKTDAEVAAIKANAPKRMCTIATTNLRNKIVLIDYDKGCDQTDKCVQAQKAGAAVIIVIYDATKKDGEDLQSEEFDNDIKIPVFAVTQKQGDSIRAHLPSKVALFVRKIKTLAKTNNLAVQPTDTLSNKTASTSSKVQNVNSSTLPVQSEADLFDQQFSISPNPATGYINVRCNMPEPQSARIRVISSNGELVYVKEMDANAASGTNIIDTKNWSSGIYSIAIDHEHTMLHMEKVIVVH